MAPVFGRVEIQNGPKKARLHFGNRASCWRFDLNLTYVVVCVMRRPMSMR